MEGAKNVVRQYLPISLNMEYFLIYLMRYMFSNEAVKGMTFLKLSSIRETSFPKNDLTNQFMKNGVSPLGIWIAFRSLYILIQRLVITSIGILIIESRNEQNPAIVHTKFPLLNPYNGKFKINGINPTVYTWLSIDVRFLSILVDPHRLHYVEVIVIRDSGYENQKSQRFS